MLNKTFLSLISDKNLQQQLSLIIVASTLKLHKDLTDEFKSAKKRIDSKNITSLGSVEFNFSSVRRLLELETKLKKIDNIIQKHQLNEIDFNEIELSPLCIVASDILDFFANTIESSGDSFKISEEQKNQRLAHADLLKSFNTIVHIEMIDLHYEMTHPAQVD